MIDPRLLAWARAALRRQARPHCDGRSNGGHSRHIRGGTDGGHKAGHDGQMDRHGGGRQPAGDGTGKLPPGGGLAGQPGRIPPLWLFTDTHRLPDPRPTVARLPRGLAGVVLRHDDDPHRAALGRDLARLCRARRLTLVVAGDVRLAAALGAGVHLRAGRWPGPLRRRGIVTSSAHGIADLRRAARAGATLAFLSPVFPTASHPGAPALGLPRWAGMIQRAPLPVGALGGVRASKLRALPPELCRAIGAIGALG